MSRLARLAIPSALVVLIALSLVACQSQPTPTPAPAAKTEPTKAPAAPAVPTKAAAPAQAAPTKAPVAPAVEMDPQQHFRVNTFGEPPTLDPNMSSWDTSIAIVHQVFEGLLKFDKDLNLVPAVAKEIPTVPNGGISADGKTYTFKLRNDVKFSDGTKVTAKNFEYSVKRMLDPTLKAEYASFYYDIVGAKEYNSSNETDAAKQKALRDAVGVEAKDEVTLEIKLTRPRSSFLQVASLWPIAPLREEIISANSTADKPDKWTENPQTYVGNGPFKMTEWVHQDHITLVPNELYYGPKPKLKKITLTMVTDIQANYAAYLNGEREVAPPPVALFAQVMQDPKLSKELVRAPLLSTFAIQFNHKQKPFDNLKVRQAFSTAIDRDAFVDKIRRGVGKAAYSWIPPGMPGYQPELGQQYKFDSAKAKQLLKDAGYPDGQGLPKITYQYANTGNNQQVAEFAQEQWKTNLGIDVTLEPMEPKAFSQAVNKGQYMMGFYGWGADYPDPDNWLPELFGTDAGNNHTYYSNSELDQLMNKAIAEPDSKKRMQMWADAQKMIVDDAVVVFLFHNERFLLAKPYVKDIYFNGMDFNAALGGRSYGQVWLEKH